MTQSQGTKPTRVWPHEHQFWKYHTATGTVKCVKGDPWPGTDEEGETCYENTHFKTEEEAWEAMWRDACAGVSLAGSAVKAAQQKLREAEQMAGDACRDYALVRTNRRQQEQRAAKPSNEGNE